MICPENDLSVYTTDGSTKVVHGKMRTEICTRQKLRTERCARDKSASSTFN
jgi:hypothetical protein